MELRPQCRGQPREPTLTARQGQGDRAGAGPLGTEGARLLPRAQPVSMTPGPILRKRGARASEVGVRSM